MIMIMIMIMINNLPHFSLAHWQPRDFPPSVSMMIIGTEKEPTIRLSIILGTMTITGVNGAMIMASIKMDPAMPVFIAVTTIAFSPQGGRSWGLNAMVRKILFAQYR